jgi:hypothetical protein
MALIDNNFEFWHAVVCDEELGGLVFYNATGAELWYLDKKDDKERTRYIKLVGDIPGTLSGDILRWKKDLPLYKASLEIVGNFHKIIDYKPFVKRELDEVSDDINAEIDVLPLITYDETVHFKKKPLDTSRKSRTSLRVTVPVTLSNCLGRVKGVNLSSKGTLAISCLSRFPTGRSRTSKSGFWRSLMGSISYIPKGSVFVSQVSEPSHRQSS